MNCGVQKHRVTVMMIKLVLSNERVMNKTKIIRALTWHFATVEYVSCGESDRHISIASQLTTQQTHTYSSIISLKYSVHWLLKANCHHYRN